jgi:TRAP-type C4-dicarboxylate transport system permease small subunit
MSVRALLERLLGYCESLLVWVSVFATFAMMCLTTLEAASRYIFNRPIIGAYEITEKYLMVAAIFLGLSYAYRGGAFIRVTFLVDRLPATLKLVADYLAQIISLGFCLAFAITATQQALRVLAGGTLLSTVPVPLGPAYFMVPLGFLALAILVLVDLPKVRTGQSRLFKEDAPTA